ncbi:Leucyl/phenylalanyl-tRNA--protein transferase [uncultured Thiomicrorhabdus sp.]
MTQFTAEHSPFWLAPSPVEFPPTEFALVEPDGLLAIGGSLTAEWLLTAYRNGIFPWFNPDDPILWWTPNPRSVLPIKQLKVSRSLRKRWKDKVLTGAWQIKLDTAFSKTMAHCANIERKGQDGTWICTQMLHSYSELHAKGHAHSVEVWEDEQLIGGLYGIGIGKMFYGESMFAKQPDASKIALTALCLQLDIWGFEMVDTQVETEHLNSLGATLIDREKFETNLKKLIQTSFPVKKWQFDIDWQDALNDFLKRQKLNNNQPTPLI